MSGELLTVRMLCIAANSPDVDIWRSGIAQASVPIEFSALDATAAAAQLLRGGIDVCLLDASLPEAEINRVIKAARAVDPQPFLAAFAPRGRARLEGVDGILRRPSTADEARRMTELCVRVKIPTRVLIVDDSATMRSIVRKILSASRFALDIHEANEGIAALNQLRGAHFGMVFLDYNMPGLNGFETLSEIKRERPGTAVVMMTSTLDNAIADRAHAAGALAFLKKPFYPADIDAVLHRYFGMYMPVS